jgi:hypothetical protein
VQAKALAESTLADWRDKPLPRQREVASFQSAPHHEPGVYVLENDVEVLYVGEALDVGSRIAQFVDHSSWSKLGLSKVRVIPGERGLLHGLQSALIGRTRPWLNTSLLRPSWALAETPLAESLS